MSEYKPWAGGGDPVIAHLSNKIAGLVYFTWDIQSNVVQWSTNGVAELLGVTPKSGVVSQERLLADIIHPDDVQTIRQLVSEALTTGSARGECRLNADANGRVRSLEMIIDRLDQDAGPFLVGVLKEAQGNPLPILSLMDDLSGYSDPDSVLNHVGEKLAETLRIHTLALIDIDESTGRLGVHHLYSDRYSIADLNRSGEIVNWVDSDTWQKLKNAITVTNRNQGESSGFDLRLDNASIVIPFFRHGHLTCLVAAYGGDSNDWPSSKLELLQEVAHRFCLRIDGIRAEQALKESEERFRSLFHSIQEGFCIIEVLYNEEGEVYDHIILVANPAFEDHTGLKNPDGKAASELMPGLENYWNELYKDVIQSGKPAKVENFSGAFERYFTVLVNKVDEKRVAVVFSDITERKKMIESLQENRELLETALEATELGVWTLDLATDVSSVRSFRHDQLFGYSEPQKEWGSEIAERHILPEDKPAFREAFVEAEKSGKFLFEGRVKWPDESIHWIRAQGKTIFDDEGIPVRMVGSIADITDLKNSERELIEADRRKDEFLATLAHELRNPLTPIKGALDLLKQTGNKQLDLKARDIIERQVDKLVHLIDDLIDISRITRNKIHLKKELVSLSGVVEVARETINPLIVSAGHTFQCEVVPDDLSIVADENRILQILTNLLTNAIKYTPAGGEISLIISREEKDVVMRVRDTGIGIPKEDLQHVFEMFRQVDIVDNDRVQEGLGIGLNLVKNLVAMHGGSVEAYSNGSGTGSEFVVRLPATDGPLPAGHVVEDSSVAYEEQDSVKKKILFVDDNEDIADITSEGLKARGFEVRACYSSQEGLDMIEDFQPEVAILDLGLPKMDGYQLARRIRMAIPEILLIAHSGWGQEKDIEKSKAAGFDFHLTKPVSLEALVARIKQGKPTE